MFEQNSWFCSVDHHVVSVDQNVKVFRRNVLLMDIILPSSLHYCDELRCLLHDPKQSWFSKVRKFLNRAFGWSSSNALRYILIGDESILIYSGRLNAMHIFSIESLVDEEEQLVNLKGVFSTRSPNGDFAYLNNKCSQILTIYNLQSNTKFSKSFKSRSVSGIAVVRDGVILYNETRTPELWNNDLTRCLATFDVLVGMKKCLPVSDEVIACVYDSYVTFFNVFTKEIESETRFNKKVRVVFACSIEYHVLAAIESSEFSL